MKFTLKTIIFVTVIAVLLPCGLAVERDSDTFITLATTTSTENSGLLSYLHPEFKKATGITVRVIPRGTGAALKLGENGDCDVVMVHSRPRENAFVKSGFGVQRFDLMHNDFVLLGPVSDPARANGKPIVEALSLISKGSSPFVSRGDKSGTHSKEESLWKKAGIEPGVFRQSVGQGMGKTLIIASEKQAYTLSDRGTWLAMKDKLALTIISQGAESLANPYSVIPVNPEKHPHVKADLVMKYVNWLLSEPCQKMINAYTRNGEQLFYADALKKPIK